MHPNAPTRPSNMIKIPQFRAESRNRYTQKILPCWTVCEGWIGIPPEDNKTEGEKHVQEVERGIRDVTQSS